MENNSIIINGLTKTYRNGVKALKGINLEIKKGSFFALLGPNGAGKSTLINILASLVIKSAGSVAVMGYDSETQSANIKQQLGLMPQEVNMGIFERLDNILLNQAGYYGIPRSVAIERMDKLLAQLSLTGKKKSIIRNLSGGMKRRVMVARAMMHDPEILILDEPSAGVDIEIRRNMWEFFQELNRAGKTIILTTHYLEEAEKLCDHVAIINHGELIESCNMQSLLRRLEHEYFILYLEEEAPDSIHLDNCDVTRTSPKTLEVKATKDLGISCIITGLVKQGVKINSIRNKSNRLESLFLELTNKHLEKES